jgi:hypothetical protein
VRVARSELFEYVVTDGTGLYGAYWSINPANSVMFPWCSYLGALFEQYSVKSMTVEFIPSCNYIATGMLALSFQYDVADMPNVEFANVSMYQGAVSGVVRTPLKIQLALNRCQFQRYYLLNNGVYTVDRTTCPAYLVVACNGGPLTTPLGRIQVTYDIEFVSAQNPERPLTLHSAIGNADGFTIPTAGEPFTNLFWTVTVNPGNVPDWFRVAGNRDLFEVKDDVDEIQLWVCFVGDAANHPYSRAWAGSGYISNHTCLVNITGAGGPQPRCNDYYVGCTDIVGQPGTIAGIFVCADILRPLGTIGTWTFRFEFYAITSNTYVTQGANTFARAHMEVAAAIS